MEPPKPIPPTREELAAIVAKAPKTAQERYEHALKALEDAEDEYARWCFLGRAAKAALECERFDKARDYAEELMELVSIYQDDWNYGNAVQDSNLVLGVLALREGNTDTACAHLFASVRTKGSPQMNSFGPNMALAKALIEDGEVEAVLVFFELCRGFWKMHRGRHWHC